MSEPVVRDSLPGDFPLLWYKIKGVLGRGGFGITYLANDGNLDHKVAIKEYLPLDFAARVDAESTVRPLTSTHEDMYKWGLDNFISEAKTLAKFKHPNIVRVITVFDKYNTAYMVMEYEKGVELSKLIKEGKHFSEKMLLDIFIPLIEGLEVIHTEGFIHRDIKPSNILVRDDGSPVLLDFGSARVAASEHTRTVTAMVTYGYAPFEQYNQGNEKQGYWSDIYSMAATIYHAITQTVPVDSMKRAISIMSDEGDPLEPISIKMKGQYSDYFLRAIDAGLSSNINERPQSTHEWHDMLLGKIDVPHKINNYRSQVVDAYSDKTVIMPKGQNQVGETLNKTISAIPKFQSRKKSRIQSFTVTTFILVMLSVGLLYLVLANELSFELLEKGLSSKVAFLKADEPENETIPVQRIKNVVAVEIGKTVGLLDERVNLQNIIAKRPSQKLVVPVVKASKIASGPKITPPKDNAVLNSSEIPNGKAMPKKAVVKTPLEKNNKHLVKPKKVKSPDRVIKIDDINKEAPKLIEKFLLAFKNNDRASLIAIANLSARKRQLVDLLFSEYQSGLLTVNSFQIYQANNHASAKLVVDEMINHNGEIVKPGGRWNDIRLEIKPDKKGIAKIYWQ